MGVAVCGLLAAAALAALVWFLARSRRPPAIVLGRQMAAAEEAERARLAAGPVAPSPLPADLRYDRWQGDFDLSNPRRLPLDEALSELVRRYAAGDDAVRAQLRGSASKEDFYTLLAFSRRSAVFALRDGSRQHVTDGLNAVAMIERKRIDPRDAPGPLGLLYYVAREMGADANHLFSEAAARAEPAMAAVLLSFPKRPPAQWDIHHWGFTVIQTEDGPGLLDWQFESYQPTYPLEKIALGIAEFVRADKYQPSITVATRLPAVWLSAIDDRALEGALASVRAGVTIHGNLRPHESPAAAQQFLVIFVVEAGDAPAAGTLLRLYEEKRMRQNAFFIAASREDRLFALAVARSFVQGAAAFETQASMARFSDGMACVLRKHASGPPPIPFPP